jgi:hypothetical protein
MSVSMPPRFQLIRKTQVPEASRGLWRTAPVARLDIKRQLYFSRLAARIFAGRRLAVVEFDSRSHTLKFTAIETAPKGIMEDDLFGLTWANG